MFVKYPSIENSYREKEIFSWLSYHPSLVDEIFVVQEKIDGANIQFVFVPNQIYEIYSRTQKADSSFYGIGEILVRQEWKTFLSIAQKYVDENDVVLRLYGEIFGQNIQNRIYYCEGKKILFFDASVDGHFLCNEDFWRLFGELSHWHFCVPVLTYNLKGLEAALAYNETFDSLVAKEYLGNDAKAIAEGVVVKPRYKTYQSPEGSLFYLKKKNEKFAEKTKVNKPEKQIDYSILSLKNQFVDYVNENRVLSVFSKCGEIQDVKQIGQYIQLIIADAREDFERDTDISNLTKDELKTVYNVGNIIVNILKKYL